MKNRKMRWTLLSVLSLMVLALSQAGAACASVIHGHEPQVPEKLRIED